MLIKLYQSIYLKDCYCTLNRPLPTETFIAKPKIDHADFMSETWRIMKPQHCVEYLKCLIERSLSVALYLKSDPSKPVSWAFVSSFGHINGVYTVEEHRRKGYSRVTVLCLIKQILGANMMPLYGAHLNNIPSLNLCTSLGFVEVCEMTCEKYS